MMELQSAMERETDHCTTIICSGNGSKPFLSGSVPNLQFHSGSVQLDRLQFEIDTDRRDEIVVEGVVAESQQQTRFTHSGVTNHEQFH